MRLEEGKTLTLVIKMTIDNQKTAWRRTDSKCANKDTKDICIASLLNDGVPPHQEFIRFFRLKGRLLRCRVISMDLEVYKKSMVSHEYGSREERKRVRTGVVGWVKSRFVNARVEAPT
jgi:hypothetical protein